LKEAASRWQVLATTRMLLESIKNDYERNRQPETLREASGYLTRMTGGRYRRVWTPLGDEVLRVDDSAGHALPVEVLSRGTREQLFLSLRMALVGSYARRGASMPLVLDDVLVNFDTDRARAAAAVLRDFAADGHQLLVFTCHEHLAAVFKSLDVRVRRLPSNFDLSDLPEPQAEPEVAPAEPPKRRRSRPKSEPTVEPVSVAPEPPRREAAPAALPIATEIVASEPIVPSVIVEPMKPPVRRPAVVLQHRADPAHKRIILGRIRRGWSAEEFEGELEDRVAGVFTADGHVADEDLNGDTSDI
ncbi:MAG TPA: hypothetical protein VG056_02390, partial [Pirellulales bacterium]|nr:hypothetical protein [Pirellulales bacterium]